MNELNFSICHLLVSKSISVSSISASEYEEIGIPPGLGFPSKEILMPFFNKKEDQYDKKEENYSIRKINEKDEYFWLCIAHGSTKPRPETVYNVKESKKESNPRTGDQAELDKQLFCLYSFTQRKLYISNMQNTKFLQEYLNKRWSKQVVIKRCFKRMEETIELIEKVKQVEFKVRNERNLFSENDSADKMLSGKTIDPLGLDDQEADITLKIDYKRSGITNRLPEKLKGLIGMARKKKIEGLILTGLDDENTEGVFNLDNFVKRIPLSIEKNAGGLYDPDKVMSALIKQIEKQE